MNDEEMRKALRSLRDAPRIPKERREAAFEQIRSEWKAGLAERASSHAEAPRRRWMWASAASVLVVLFASLFLWVSPDAETPRVRVATIALVHGDGAFRHNEPIYASQVIETGAATLSVKLASGLVVRAAPDSKLTFSDGSHLELKSGRIFVDSNAAKQNDPLIVQTTLGDIKHLGTQYLVEHDGKRLNVAVREGVIALQDSPERHAIAKAAAGEQLSVSAIAPQTIERATISTADERWDWIETVPSPLDIDGIRLGKFLQWYERETGRRIVLRNADPDTRLNGSIAGLTPDDALMAIAAAVELEVTQQDEAVLISKP